ncbi:MAG: acyl transferase [Ferruginibacter sp.]
MKELTGHKELKSGLFKVSENTFTAFAFKLFEFQYEQNPIYRQFCQAIGKHPVGIDSIEQIAFLPIQFFKTKEITTGVFEPKAIFESSGTTGQATSKHIIKDTAIYEESFLRCFTSRYGDVSKYCIVALLPSYLDRKNSSLVYMVKELIARSKDPQSEFYLNDVEKLHRTLLENEKAGKQTLLIGVTYALLDFFQRYPMSLNHTIIMETGGMKGRAKEFTRNEVHSQLMKQSGVNAIHAEYGMTELLSQAYAEKNGIFRSPPWMKVFVREEDDPFCIRSANNGSELTGAINIIDLANIYSCSFIATDDMGKLYTDGSFEVLGRLDNSDIRGCSLLLDNVY